MLALGFSEPGASCCSGFGTRMVTATTLRLTLISPGQAPSPRHGSLRPPEGSVGLVSAFVRVLFFRLRLVSQL